MKKKIIIIEHEAEFQDMIINSLSEAGFEVMLAKDGETGLELIKKEKPSLVLLNPYSPRLDGFNLLEKLKQDNNCKNIPALILIHLEDLNEAEKVLRLGGATYLVKEELDRNKILNMVNQAVNQN